MDEQDDVEPGVRWSYRVTQALFTGTALGCFLIFWYAGAVLRIPAEYRHGGSLLRQPTIGGAILSLFTLVVLLIGCTLLASAFLRGRWFLGSLSAASAGLSAWSMRGGPMHEVLLYAPSSGVFIQLAVELALLGAMIAAIWLFLWQEPSPEAEPLQSSKIVTSVVLQTILMGIVVLILAQTDAKKQCVAAVFIAGLVASSVMQSNSPAPQAGRWYWIAPIAVGVTGYLLAAIQSQGWITGSHELDGFWAPLARPLPLDYASAGMFGALLGYWMSIPDTEDAVEDQPGAVQSGAATKS